MNENTHPPLFRDLTDAEAGALLLAQHRGQTIEYFMCGAWRSLNEPGFFGQFAYRIALTPDTVDWSHLDKEWKFITRDADQRKYQFTDEPIARNECWALQPNSLCARVTTPSFRNNGLPWEQSLIRRPEDV